MKKVPNKDWKETLIDMIEDEIECAGKGTDHYSPVCRMNDITDFVEKLLNEKHIL